MTARESAVSEAFGPTLGPDVDGERAFRGKPADDLAVGRRVIETERDGLDKLASTIDGTFIAAVEVLAAARGRVVVTGMGKSGHIARKIAATLASTGTPAQFVHPAEASHGDLGMITSDDAVLAISNSGETAELSDIVAHTRRFQIALVAIVGRTRSTLTEAADHALVLPDCPEACPMGLAPTTSTTMTLALGDALAIALLDRADFSAARFQDLHPGGALGNRLVTVQDIMHTGARMPLIGPDASMADGILEMTAKSFGCIGVVGGDGRLIGIVTDGDLRRHMKPGLLEMTAGAVMTAKPKVIRPNALAAEALWVMSTRSISSLFVARDGTPIGILHLHDCLNAGIA